MTSATASRHFEVLPSGIAIAAPLCFGRFGAGSVALVIRFFAAVVLAMAAKSVSYSDTSEYVASLSRDDRARYATKIGLCGIDPFLLDARECLFNADLWPHITVMDIHDFLVSRTSFITSKQLKNYKALEAHNYVTSGWVKEPWVKQAGQDAVIVVTEVSVLIS